MSNRPAYIFSGGYLLFFLVCAINPYDRAVWWAENIPIMILVTTIVVAHRYHNFSPVSFFFMSFLVILHTIGGHYTFKRVPFSLITETFSFERNHYDRLAHFSVGFYAFPIAEILLKKRLVTSVVVLAMFPVFAILSVAGCYEIFEWGYAISADTSAGNAVLGSQGDIWDAQKDILADGLGAVFAMILFFYMHRSGVVKIKNNT